MANKKQTTAERTVAALRAAGLTLSCAESCTGGLIAQEITDVPGASAVFHGGVVSYVNAVKRDVLGVRAETLAEHGAVSPQTAREMAEGARRVLDTDLAVSVTGVAGPDRDDRDNEVGTVYIALAAPEGTECVLHRFFGGSRDQIRHAAAEEALTMVLAHLQQAPPEGDAP